MGLETLGGQIDLRKALRRCGLYDSNSPDVHPQIRNSIVNTMSPQAHHFLALPE